MSKENVEKLYQYYQDADILPTHAHFSQPEQLKDYERLRADIFTDKLKLPKQIFNGIDLIEFGPDSGENSLIFAQWGASLTLVEPNPNSWQHIEDYFDRFGFKGRLQSLVKTDIEGFKTDKKFQFIDAEGFIYTVKPQSLWINLFNKILEKDGFFLISYCEAFGCLWEFILKFLYLSTKKITGWSSYKAAWKLFEAKWNSIPHTRSFDSWVMDVLENPFVSLKYAYYAHSICSQLYEAGFKLYSSWPNYIDYSKIYWHKKTLPPAVNLENNLDFIKRSTMSFTFGRKLFICSGSQGIVEEINETVKKLIVLVNQSIEDFGRFNLREAEDCLQKVKRFIESDCIIIASSPDKKEALQSLNSMGSLFNLIAKRDTAGLIKFCNTDSVFISTWGIPAHFAVFRKVLDK